MMKVSNFHFLNLVKLLITVVAPILFISSCGPTKNEKLNINELNEINKAYIEYFNDFNAAVTQLAGSENVKVSIENRQVPQLESYSNVKAFDIQGNSFTNDETIRDTVGYQRLMGHMDYYSYIESVDGIGYLTSVVKIYNTNNPDPFRGILKVSKPLTEFFDNNQYSSGYYLLDSNKTLVDSDGTAIVLDKEELDKLSRQQKDISSLQESRGSVELSNDSEQEPNNYVIKDGVGVFAK